MIKRFILHTTLTFTVLFSVQVSAQSIYDFNITTLNGQSHLLSEYAGKKIAFIIIPSTHASADSLLLDSINVLASTYQDSITIIGVPSYETGYYDDSLTSLTAFYDSLVKSPCIITQGLATTKASVYQDPLFKWLTNETQNGHFNIDAGGVGQSFFVDNGGALYGVFASTEYFNDALIRKMLQVPATQTQ